MPVAQLDRVSDSDSEGRAFESHRAYQKKAPTYVGAFFNDIRLSFNQPVFNLNSVKLIYHRRGYKPKEKGG